MKTFTLTLLLFLSTVAYGMDMIDESFTTTASSSTVMAVLTDFNHLSSFVPSLEKSIVVSTDTIKGIEHTYVHQIGKASFLGFSRKINVLLDITIEPGIIRFVDILGEDFSLYKGYWDIRIKPGSVSYHLDTNRTFSAPDGISKHVLKKTVRKLMKAVKVEIERRDSLR